MSQEVEAPLVSVVVPVYNGASTIERTLQSISAQTYSNLEVIVVDDGSVDDTASIVRNYSTLDVRVRLVQQANLGVARARNAGLRDSRGQFVAPIDADDLWHPTRIAKHMQVMTAHGEQVAVVYSPCRCIDESDKVLETMPGYGCAGWVLLQLIYCNFVANGSGLLLRKAAVVAVGGYDPRLREYGFEGCEDYQLQLALAQRYQFAVVPEYLIGYRVRGPRMSLDRVRMARSMAYILNSVRQSFPGIPAAPFELNTFRHSPARGAMLLRLARPLAKHRLFCALLFGARLKMKLKRALQATSVLSDVFLSAQHSKSFLEYDANERACSNPPLYDVYALAHLARMEASLYPLPHRPPTCQTAETHKG